MNRAGIARREAFWTAAVLCRFLEPGDAKAPEDWRGPRPSGLGVGSSRGHRSGGSLGVPLHPDRPDFSILCFGLWFSRRNLDPVGIGGAQPWNEEFHMALGRRRRSVKQDWQSGDRAAPVLGNLLPLYLDRFCAGQKGQGVKVVQAHHHAQSIVTVSLSRSRPPPSSRTTSPETSRTSGPFAPTAVARMHSAFGVRFAPDVESGHRPLGRPSERGQASWH